MALIPLGTDDIQSEDENAARIYLENMYLIDSPYSPDNVSRVSRPTLTTVVELGPGPVSGIYRKDGVFDGKIFTVSGINLYTIDINDTVLNIGQIPGNGFCLFAGGTFSTGSRLLILRDGVVYSYDGLVITVVNIPDVNQIGAISYLESYFLLSVVGNAFQRGRFYWIAPGDTDPDVLNFATAEREADDLVYPCVLGDEVWMLGSSSGEVWITTGIADAPFQPVQARAYNYGCLTRDSVVVSTLGGNPSLLWVTDARIVAMAQANASPQRVSNDSVEEILRSAENIRAWGFVYNRHSFYVITCNQATLVYDLAKQTWSRWSSFLKDYWRAHLGCQIGGKVYAGDSEENRIWKLEEGVSDDDDPVIRTVSGLVAFQGNYLSCSRVNVVMNSGWTQDYDENSVLELRWSDDLGYTYGSWVQMNIGQKGQYKTDVTFSGLGMVRRPGRLFQFRFSEKSRFRLDYATMNEM